MNTDDVQYLDWQWVEENPESALDLMLKLHSENAALREKAERYRLVTLRQDADNTALRNKLAALENQTQWECSCGGTDCEGQKENAALRSLLREAITEHVDPYDLPEGDHYIARAKAVLGIPPTQEAVTAARKEATP